MMLRKSASETSLEVLFSHLLLILLVPHGDVIEPCCELANPLLHQGQQRVTELIGVKLPLQQFFIKSSHKCTGLLKGEEAEVSCN